MIALAYMHNLNIAHRDVKLDNALVTAWDGATFQSVHVVLSDFGFARVSDAFSSCRTFLGTPLYMAPEVWRTKYHLGIYGYAADVFAAGTFLYLLSSLCTPWLEHSTPEAQIRFEDVTFDHLDDAAMMSTNMQEIIKTAMTRNPQDRCTSDGLRRALELCS